MRRHGPGLREAPRVTRLVSFQRNWQYVLVCSALPAVNQPCRCAAQVRPRIRSQRGQGPAGSCRNQRCGTTLKHSLHNHMALHLLSLWLTFSPQPRLPTLPTSPSASWISTYATASFELEVELQFSALSHRFGRTCRPSHRSRRRMTTLPSTC